MTLPRTISQKAFAALIGIHENTASNLRRAGVLVLSPDRRALLLAESLRAYIDYVGNGREADMTLAQAQKQLINLQADKLRLANAHRAGELLPASMVLQLQDSMTLQLKAACEGMPARHAKVFADPRAFVLLQTAAGEILDQVATWLERSQAPKLAAIAADARDRARHDGVYDAGGDDADRSAGASADRADADHECTRAGDRKPKSQAPRATLPRARRSTSSATSARRKR